MKITRFSSISKNISFGNYRVNHFLYSIPKTIEKYINDYGLNLNPDFQRGRVWTDKQRSAYIEYLLKGGMYSKDILFNCPNWIKGKDKLGLFEIVDGKQRLDSCLMFFNNEITAFGSYFKDYEDSFPKLINLNFCINELNSREEVLRWYLELNQTGKPHSKKELDRVKVLLNKEISLKS